MIAFRYTANGGREMVGPGPMNGPVFINGYFGDAILRTGQGVANISRRLTDGLIIREKIVNGKPVSVVDALIRIGTNGLEMKFEMVVTDNEDNWFDVILGNDFFAQMGVLLDVGSNGMISRHFGTVCGGSMRPFERKSFRNTCYRTDLDGRVIILLDMDCFEVQVHEHQSQKGYPRVVANSSGRIVAVSYEAKQLGIHRETTPYVQQALKVYPNLIIINLPTRDPDSSRPRPDARVARQATADIVTAIKTVLASIAPGATVFQYSSGDEFYVDLTAYVNQQQNEQELVQQLRNIWRNTFLYNDVLNGLPSHNYIWQRIQTLERKTMKSLPPLEYQEARLIYGSTVANYIVNKILEDTGYQSSVGIGSKKLIAKIASGMHKPGSITILAPSGLKGFASCVKVGDIPGLGGKLGSTISQLFQVSTMNQLQHVSFTSLSRTRLPNGQLVSDEKATQILNWAYGIDDKQVEPSDCSKSSGVSRQLFGHNYSSDQIQQVIWEQIVEFVEKIQFERRVNFRIPAKVKITIIIDNMNLNLNSTITIAPGEQFPYGEQELYRRFLGLCTPPLAEWDPNWRAENLQISATF